MNDAEEHDGEREVKDHDRRRSKSFRADAQDPTAKLVQSKARDSPGHSFVGR